MLTVNFLVSDLVRSSSEALATESTLVVPEFAMYRGDVHGQVTVAVQEFTAVRTPRSLLLVGHMFSWRYVRSMR